MKKFTNQIEECSNSIDLFIQKELLSKYEPNVMAISFMNIAAAILIKEKISTSRTEKPKDQRLGVSP